MCLWRVHRYLMNRLSLQVFYLFVDSTAICIMVVKFRNTICPPPPHGSPFIWEGCAVKQFKRGTWSAVYIAERTPKSNLYIERCLWDGVLHVVTYIPGPLTRTYKDAANMSIKIFLANNLAFR
jgi:hypothetical protein